MEELELNFKKSKIDFSKSNRKMNASFSIDAVNDIKAMWFDQAEYDRQLLNKKLDVLIFDADPFDTSGYPALERHDILVNTLGKELQDEMDKELLNE